MLGDLSKKYESNGDPGCISSGWGDAGGKSYGMYQMSSRAGVVDEYIRWLQQNGYWFGENLAEHPVGSIAFDDAWRWLADPANGNAEAFKQSQHDYIKAMYYNRACAELEKNLYHVDLHSDVMKDVIWSRAVQYGPGNIVEMFTAAAASLNAPNLSYVDAACFDDEMIKAIYLNVCSTPEWTNGSPALRQSLYNRFQVESDDALKMLCKEKGEETWCVAGL